MVIRGSSRTVRPPGALAEGVGVAPKNEAARVGQVRRHRALGSEAVYQVTAECGDLVEVEAIRVPGLDRGTRMKFTAQAVSSMELLSEAPAGSTGRASLLGRLTPHAR